MRHLGLIISLILTFVIGVSPVTYAGEQYQKDGFAISIPGDWVEIPRDVIDQYEAALAKLNPSTAPPHYDYGFQLDGAEYWLELPYILVQVNSNGRVPESEIYKLEEFSPQEVVEKQEGLRSVMSNIQAGKMYFDKDMEVIWMRMASDVANVGRVSGLSGLVLTGKGYIAVNGYSLEEESPEYEPAFRAIVKSVTPESGLEYKSD